MFCVVCCPVNDNSKQENHPKTPVALELREIAVRKCYDWFITECRETAKKGQLARIYNPSIVTSHEVEELLVKEQFKVDSESTADELIKITRVAWYK